MKTAFKNLVLSVSEKYPQTYLFGFDASRHRILSDKAIDFPVCEETIIGAGLGAARAGAHVFVDLMFIPFIFRAFDVIVNQLCLSQYVKISEYGSLTIRARCGPFEGAGPQHGNEVLSLLVEVPHLLVAFPRFERSVPELYLEAQKQGKTLLLLESPYETKDTDTHIASSKKTAINVAGGYAPVIECAIESDSNLKDNFFIRPIERMDEFYLLRFNQDSEQLLALPRREKVSAGLSIGIFPEGFPHTWENAVQYVCQQLRLLLNREPCRV